MFPDGLAFDILPSIGTDNGGPSTAEQSINRLSSLIRASDRFRTRLQVTPIFAGIGHVQISLARDVLPEEVVELLNKQMRLIFDKIFRTYVRRLENLICL